MKLDPRLPIQARKNCRHATSERTEELHKLLHDLETACILSELHDPSRRAHWQLKATELEQRVRSFAGITDQQISKIELPKKENRFSESLA